MGFVGWDSLNNLGAGPCACLGLGATDAMGNHRGLPLQN